MNPPAEVETRVAITRIVHTIHATADISACRKLYLNILGGLIFAEAYQESEDHDMALLYVADHMIEPMGPRDLTRDRPIPRFISRYGQGFQSFELMVDDAPAASRVLRDAGCKLAADFGVFFFVREASTGGVLLQITDRHMPNDPYDRSGWRGDRLAGHGAGVRALDHVACLTPNADAAIAFFTRCVDGEVLEDGAIAAPEPARKVLIRLADARIAFVQPEDIDGPLHSAIAPRASGIYALVWQVEDLAAAEAFFTAKGLRTTRERCISNGFAIEPDDFQGARHEFVKAA